MVKEVDGSEWAGWNNLGSVAVTTTEGVDSAQQTVLAQFRQDM